MLHADALQALRRNLDRYESRFTGRDRRSLAGCGNRLRLPGRGHDVITQFLYRSDGLLHCAGRPGLGHICVMRRPPEHSQGGGQQDVDGQGYYERGAVIFHGLVLPHAFGTQRQTGHLLKARQRGFVIGDALPFLLFEAQHVEIRGQQGLDSVPKAMFNC